MPASVMGAARGHLLARGDHGVVFAGRRAAPSPAGTTHQLVGPPAMADTTTATWWASIDLALDVARDIADAVDVGDRVPPNFITRRAIEGLRQTRGTGNWRKPRSKRRVNTYRGGVSRTRGPKESVMAPRSAACGRIDLDADEVARFSALAANLVDPPARWACCTSQSGAAFLHQKAAACRKFEPIAKRLEASAACASSTSAAAPAS